MVHMCTQCLPYLELFCLCYLVSEVLQLVFPFFLIWSQFLSTLVNVFRCSYSLVVICAFLFEASFNTSLGLTQCEQHPQCVTLTQTTVVPTGPTQ